MLSSLSRKEDEQNEIYVDLWLVMNSRSIIFKLFSPDDTEGLPEALSASFHFQAIQGKLPQTEKLEYDFSTTLIIIKISFFPFNNFDILSEL